MKTGHLFQAKATPGWMVTGATMDGTTTGFRDVGTDHRMQAPTGATRIMTTTTRVGRCIKAIGIMTIMATTMTIIAVRL